MANETMKKNKILNESETDRTANDKGVASTDLLDEVSSLIKYKTDILERLKKLHKQWMNMAKQAAMIKNSETKKSNLKMTTDEMAMFNYLNCANELKKVLDDS